jgi:hypothetical protein
MRYIRTRDSDYGCIIVDTVKYEEFTGEEYEIPDEEIVAEADTIEELCDEFVYKNRKYNKFIGKVKANEGKDYIKLEDKYGFETDNILVGLINWNLIYGAIWTDKGLIYVAKMNEKGELELL